MEINQETYDLLIKIGEGFKRAFARLRRVIGEWVERNWKWLKKVVIKWYQLEEEKKVVTRQHHRRDFSRQKMSHQVINRKPHHMVRKIIR
ncbi:hypothetical protein FQ087_18755 [Sporosarcina sp. ANT_H38]|uniref:hypothetical protein n=1 Tax=Sporosarcina sp. ANT_H38 TaxID=2597358 RepID=UPI0011F3EB0C|nr:hypothetical protein [Sporosarcina sp. ANT_H38]KAA0944166.1 hypothetical protein FQ087_18755 [Sporosarcina sp. ANT_H38]